MQAEASADAGARGAELRHDWTHAEVAALFGSPFSDLMFRAQSIHRRRFDANRRCRHLARKLLALFFALVLFDVLDRQVNVNSTSRNISSD